MKILSLYSSFPSSVSLLVDNKVVAAVQEERFTRKKNDETFPKNSIDYCLKQANISPNELDAVALASFVSPFDDHIVRKSQWTIEDYLRDQHERWKPYLVDKTDKKPKSLLEIFSDKIDLNMYPNKYWKKNYKKKNRNKKYLTDRIEIIANYLGINKNKIHRIDHHRCHAAYSYYASNFRKEKVLALTVDGMGDGLNATAGIFDEKGSYKKFYQTDDCGIARIYRYMTLLLGMKPNEHEYKLMGLAPYAKEKYSKKALEVFKKTLYVDGTKFKWKTRPTDSYFWFKKKLEGIRFDNIACGLQTWVEELLVKWVKNCIKETKIKKVVLSGGVALNVKAMGKVTEISELKDLFIGGSASDDTLSIGAGFCLAEDLTNKMKKKWDPKNFFPLPNLYIGPNASYNSEKISLKKLNLKKYKIIKNFTSHTIADFLSKGKILARCAGRMEFGQRALGNRSILADPSNQLIKQKINSAIKNRDFWMPFAPVILDKFSKKYILNKKKIISKFMTIGFNVTKEGYDKLIAAIHPADQTARPQILFQKDNPELYEIILNFSKKTGIGALLNTSFNLHGHPIVNTPKDAIFVLQNSDLDGLLLNNFFIKKIK